VSLWHFYLNCGIAEAGSPGIMCIVFDTVPHDPSEHGTTSMGKYLFAKAHIAKLSESSELEAAELPSTMVDTTAFAILMREGSQQITIVISQTKFKFELKVASILTQLTDNMVRISRKVL